MVRIAITLDDDSLVVMLFLTSGRSATLPAGAERVAGDRWYREPSPENIAAEIEKSSDIWGGVPVKSWRLIDESAVPEDRSYRDAWKDDGKQIVTHMPRACAIHLGKIRKARAAKLEELDRDWMRATGQGKKKDADAVEAKRQELRDLPVTLDVESCQTVDELRQKWSPLLG